MMSGRGKPQVAFVLGGGGRLGACEVGMLRALIEAGIQPDLVVGTSVGALNGAAIAARPDVTMVDRLEVVWANLERDPAFGGSLVSSAMNLMRTRTSLHSNDSLRALIEKTLPVKSFEDLPVRFQCVAACIERAAEHWFESGRLVDAILASAAVPGLLPVVEINGEHFLDGGLVNSIPVERAVQLGAQVIYVLHVGRIEQPLQTPTNILQLAGVAFEVARRNRFARDISSVPKGVVVHVLPTGQPQRTPKELSRVRNREEAGAEERIQRAGRATSEYLAGVMAAG